MKLFHCYAHCDDYEPSELIVAETKEEALKRFTDELDAGPSWYIGEDAYEIDKVDGYKIVLVKEW